ncbi:hypothetical protein J7M07_04960, partial [bacterium]|nr:hypothetical protein [bacterium]
MRRILILILLFLFPVQLLAGSINLALGREPNIDSDSNDSGAKILLSGSGGSLEFSTCESLGLFDRVLSSGSTAGYSATLLREEAMENKDGYKRPQDYSPAGVIARSFLLPGLGQRRMGHSVKSSIYFVLEGAAWIGLGTFVWQGIARKNAYEDYAVAFAGVNGTGRSDDYYETIGNYMSNDGYNEDVRREARDYYPDDRAAQLDYSEENSIAGYDSWMWETTR